MNGWLVWVVIAVAFGIGEMLTTSFFLAPVAIAAALAAAADAAIGGVASWVVFILVSVLTLVLVRPLVKRHMQTGPQLRTGAAALVGTRAIVLERIANREGVGCVRINGEVWTARAYDDDEVIEPGALVDVVEIKGATALVME